MCLLLNINILESKLDQKVHFFRKQFSVFRPHISIHGVTTAAVIKTGDSLINDVCLNKVHPPPSWEKISSDSQIEMKQTQAVQLAIKVTNVADDGSNAPVFSRCAQTTGA